MKPWSYDAGDLDIDTLTENSIVQNHGIRQYLHEQKKFFLLGAKGTGKTLLLQYKAFQYWKKRGDEKFSRLELIENLTLNVATLSYSQLSILTNTSNWKNAWTFALTLVILRRSGIKFPSHLIDLEEEFPPYFNTSAIMSKVISEGHYFTSNFFRKNSGLSALLMMVNHDSIFLDRVDQAVSQILSPNSFKKNGKMTEKDILVIWRNAQFGLIEACWSIFTQNKQIQIFATARLEALEAGSDFRSNIMNYCTTLDYTYDELKDIFEKNIAYTPKKDFPNPNSRDPIISLFGFEKVPHLYAKDDESNPLFENVFDMIYRHTFGRPRQILAIGNRIYYDVICREGYSSLVVEEKIERIRHVVSQTSRHILEDYLWEFSPAFAIDNLDKFLESISSNVIFKSDLEMIDPDLSESMFNIGLIGYVRGGSQYFNTNGLRSYEFALEKGKVTTFILHPSLDYFASIRTQASLFFDKSNIVGNGLIFRSKTENQESVESKSTILSVPNSDELLSEDDDKIELEFIQIKNFKSIKDITIDFSRESVLLGNWTCIAGINGAGKSSILQAISILLLGDKLSIELGREQLRRLINKKTKAEEAIELLGIIRQGDRRATLYLPINSEGVNHKLIRSKFDFKIMSQNWRTIQKQVIVAYGSTRNLSDYDDQRYARVSMQVRRQMNLFDPLAQIASSDVLLNNKPNNKARRLFLKLAKRFVSEINYSGMIVEKGDDILFKQWDAEVSGIDLPDGYRSTFAWFADFCTAQFDSNRKLYPKELNQITGIVILDEIGLYLHPSLERIFVPIIRKILPNVQFITSTHSPLVLSSFDKSELFILDSDSVDGSRFLDRQVFGFSTDEIYKWLMDTTPQSSVLENLLQEKNNPDLELYLYQSPTVDWKMSEELASKKKELLDKLGLSSNEKD